MFSTTEAQVQFQGSPCVFMMEKVTLEEVFLRVLQFYPVTPSALCRLTQTLCNLLD